MNEANQSSDSACKPPTSIKNKVWLLEYVYYDDYEVLGIFTDQDLALEEHDALPEWRRRHARVFEFPINKVID